MMGLKPTTSRATIWRSNQLNYIHHIKLCRKFKVARLKGLEPLTHCLEGSCSIQLSYRRKNGAGDGNRTHVISLEGWSSTIEPHPHIHLPPKYVSITLICCQVLYQKIKSFTAHHLSISRSRDQPAFAGLVEGRGFAFIPVIF